MGWEPLLLGELEGLLVAEVLCSSVKLPEVVVVLMRPRKMGRAVLWVLKPVVCELEGEMSQLQHGRGAAPRL